MVLAIVRKELRETRVFAALALGLYLIYVSTLTSRWNRLITPLFDWVPGVGGEAPEVPFVQGNFVTMVFFIGAALAITLGFRQSAWEPSQGTALYLLHLPLRRQTIYVTKLLTGVGLLLGCTLLPILIYATWAAIPGTHPGPFEWSMTGPAFHIWLLMPLVYLGAFASGIRPGALVRLAAAAAPGRGIFQLFRGSRAVLVADRIPAALARGGGARQRYPLGSRHTRLLSDLCLLSVGAI